MTSDTKIGLLLGLIFIFVIAFVINGLPGFERTQNPNELTYNLASYQETAPELGARELHAREYMENPYVSIYNNAPGIRDTMPLPSVDPVVQDQANDVIQEIQKSQEELPMNPNLMQKHQAQKVNAWPKVAEVRKNDTLAAIAKRYYGADQGNKISNITKIFEANRDILPSLNSLKVGQQLIIPAITPSAFKAVEEITVEVESVGTPEPVVKKEKYEWYEVQEDDSLWKIASSELGNGGRYLEIAELNASILPDKNSLKPGMKLRMPVK